MTPDWIEFVHKDMCSLCGQSGIVDTRGLKTLAGLEVGRLNWCLCPNGQVLKATYKVPTQFLLDHFRGVSR